MEVEKHDHEEQSHLTLMLRKDLPVGVKSIRAIWSFKRKRFPDGTLNKHKVRLCAYGGHKLGDWITGALILLLLH
jgi:hypothetical protein